MSIRNKFAFSLAAVLAAVSLTACSGNTSSGSSSAADSSAATAENSENSDSADSAADAETAYSPENPVTVKIGLTGNVYEDIWNPIKEKLAPEGINLEYEQFTSFNIPNNALNSGEIDMNAFQHHAYFNNDTASNGYDLTAIGDTYIVAMNIYTAKDLTIESALASTETLKIAVPNDVTNEGRALKLLESAGFFTINADAGASPEISDITDYAVPVEFVEVDANLVYSVIQDVDLAVINGNYALQADLNAAEDSLITENPDYAKVYVNVVACRAGEENSDKIQALKKALQSDDVKKYVDETYKGAVVTVF